jgi:hypothetical protein
MCHDPAVSATAPLRDVEKGFRLHAAILILVAWQLSSQPRCSMATDTEAPLLRKAAAISRANRSLLVSWTGVVRKVDRFTEDGKVTAEDVATIRFAYERDQGQLWWDRVVDRSMRISDGEMKEGVFVSREGGLRADDTVTFVDDSPRPDGTRAMSVTQHAPDGIVFGADGRTFDPTYYFSGVSESIADRFTGLARFQDESDESVVVTSAGPMVSVALGGATPVNTYVVNLAKGGNLVEYIGNSPQTTTVYRIDWTERNGVWVPERFAFTNTVDNTVSERTVEWIEIHVNQPIDPKTFTIDNLGLTPGVTIYDTRTKSRTQYGMKGGTDLHDGTVLPDGTMRPPAESPLNEPPSRFGNSRRVLLIVNAVLVLLLGVAILIRRRIK